MAAVGADLGQFTAVSWCSLEGGEDLVGDDRRPERLLTGLIIVRISYLGGGRLNCYVVSGQEGFLARGNSVPLMHFDTGHNFPETLEFRDRWMKTIRANLICFLLRRISGFCHVGFPEKVVGNSRVLP